MLGRKVRCPDCEKTNHINKDPFQSGRILGDFIIKRQLGEGSIGAVYFANQISLDRNVALKILSKEYSDSKGLDAFLKEARAAAKLSHPNLVQSFGVGEEEGVCFMAMNFIEGETLKDKIKREGKIEADEALHIVQQIAEGLFYAWSESGLIHRDVKPENIMLTKESAVKLTDLGLAINESEWHEDLEISGSPSYMSPEQFTGEKIDTRSDVYSLGISLYQMISGKLPFDGATLKTVARQHFYDPPKPLNKMNPMIPSKVSALVQKMVEKDPEKRFQNMEEIIENVWQVRQATAPDKDLIPSVHTISMKRLDYDLQKLSQERQKHISDKKAKEKKKTIVWGKVLMIGLPILVSIIFLITITFSRHNKQHSATVNALGTLIDDEDITSSDLQIKWDSANAKLPDDPKNDFERELHTRMLLYHEKIKNRRLMQRKNELQKTTEKTRESASQTLRKLIDNNKRTAKLLHQKELELQQKEAKFKSEISKTANSRKQLGKTNKEKNQLNKQIKDLTEKYNRLWQNDIRVKIYYLTAKGKIDDAIVILKSARQKREGNDKWFKNHFGNLGYIQKFELSVSNSGSKYAEVKIKEGKIKNIIGGNVELTTDVGDKKLPLNTLSLPSLMSIAQRVFPDIPKKDLQEFLIIMTGSIAKIDSLTPKNQELENIFNAICEYKIDRIRRLSFSDEKKAKEDARILNKEFEEIPNWDEKYKPELKKLFQ